MNQEKRQRKRLLKQALQWKGLTFRRDSTYCKFFIETGKGSIDTIVERMCQMHYLFKYRDFRNRLEEMEQIHEERYFDGIESDGTVFEEAELDVLDLIGRYPTIYPWFPALKQSLHTELMQHFH